ncbi:YdiU family protein [Crocinitomicaceae bacterium]|nr:YdiU family protein [Crocinitomicaceae bacterium]
MKKTSWQLQNTYTDLPDTFYNLQAPDLVKKPELVFFNESLAHDLGLDFLKKEKAKIADYFSGNKVPQGAQPLSQAYAGHQFGYFNMLGDGRAILLGEQVDSLGNRFDIQLKGSGRTLFSRGGDGRATLNSMLREYLISESMHGLGISTTRSLAVVSTGEQVYRGPIHEGGVLTRVASSHIRVGTFEFARTFGSIEDLQSLTDYTIQRHYPEIAKTDHPALELLKIVMHKQIDLVIDWMRVGFIHGVMNTDNMSISGETIDYGPCAFMNAYHPKKVYSSIDKNSRYAFGNQSYIANWNLTIFANALLPLISDNEEKAVKLANGVLNEFQKRFEYQWYNMMFNKLGIVNPNKKDRVLVNDLLKLMEVHKTDYTQLFLALEKDETLDASLFAQKEFKNWIHAWKLKNPVLAQMKKYNPRIIPRNHWVENALETAVEGDVMPFQNLLKLLSKPYDDHPNQLMYEKTPADFDASYQTFCGT